MDTALEHERPRGQGRRRILAAASERFAHHGYHGTSVRDIARDVGVGPSAIYAHFPSKAELLLALYEAGVGRMIDGLDRAVAGAQGPWDRLEAACAEHLRMLTDASGMALVVIRVQPADVAEVEQALVALRDAYEDRFRDLVAALELTNGADARLFRLQLLGALNWTQTWYRPGQESPARIARQLIDTFRNGATDTARTA